MTMIFAMAGESSRFANAGYKCPKYMLSLNDKSVFYYAVSGFRRYFGIFRFIFVYRDLQDSSRFIDKECKKLNLSNYKAIELPNPTQGQAQSVYESLCRLSIADNESILIFNIDTFRADFALPSAFDLDKIDGYLEVFRAEGTQWSFVLPKDENLCSVAQTAEKDRISPLCSSGLYYFRKCGDFKSVFESMLKNHTKSKGEYYIAPMYNALIKQGKDIRYDEISPNKLTFCGTPSEYELLKQKESL